MVGAVAHPPGYDRRWRVLAVACLSLVLVVASVSSLNVALPTLARDLDASGRELQWIVDAYALVFAGLLLPFGALGDRYGRKGALQVGLGLFALCSVALTFAGTPLQLIAFRGIMGAAAALIMPATLSIITNVFPAEERARAIAIWAGFAGAGGAIGPVVSGLLLERFWWGSIFFINLPIIAVALVAGALIMPTSKDTDEQPLDPVGAVLSISGLGLLLYAIIEAPELGWLSTATLAGFAGAVVLLAGFVMWERRTASPMLPMRFFRDRGFTAGSVTISLVFFAMFGMFFTITQYLQFVLGYSALEAAFSLLPASVVLVLLAPRSAVLAERYGSRRVVGGGLLLVVAGFLVLATLTRDSGYLQLLAGVVLIAAGMANTMPPSTTAIMAAMPLGKAGVGSAVNDTTRELGGAVGIAVLGSVLNSVYRSRAADLFRDLPSEVADRAQESIAAGIAVAGGGPEALLDDVRDAFNDGIRAAILVAAAILVLAAVFVFRFMPDRPGASPGPASSPRPGPSHGDGG